MGTSRFATKKTQGACYVCGRYIGLMQVGPAVNGRPAYSTGNRKIGPHKVLGADGKSTGRDCGGVGSLALITRVVDSKGKVLEEHGLADDYNDTTIEVETEVPTNEADTITGDNQTP